MDSGSNSGSILNRLRLTRSELGQVFERRSSGLRINSASDDAAGLAVADALKVQSAGMARAAITVSDSISRVSVAESAIQELTSILGRLDELAKTSLSTALSSSQRNSLNSEFQALRTGYNRMVATTSFNGQNLFTGSNGPALVQAGFQGNADNQISYSLAFQGTAAGGTGQFQAGVTISGSDDSYRGELIDINGDTFEEMVTTLFLDAAVGIRMGNGDGTFGGQ